MATVTPAAEQRQLLTGVSWQQYEKFLEQYEGRHVRLTYCQGNLEIMSVSGEHERAKKLTARLLEALTEELNIEICGLGNWTMPREDLERGLEPDECWYIQHEAEMRQKAHIDLTINPPPDLVIEVEVTRSVLDRLEIYARLGVPEVWRCDGQSLRVLILTEAGIYTESARSRAFPQLPLDGLRSFFAQRGQVGETQLVKSFRAWVRATLVPQS